MVAVGEDEIIIDPSSTSVMWIMNGNGETVTKIDEKKVPFCYQQIYNLIFRFPYRF